MTTTQKILKNSAVLFSSHIISKLINFALILVLTRMLGSEGFGLYSFAMAYVMMFMLFTHLGINTYLIREIARRKEQAPELLGLMTPVVLLLSLLTVLIVNGGALLAGWSLRELQIILIFSAYMLFDSWSGFLVAVFRAYQRMEFEALLTIFERLGLLVATLLIWQYGGGLLLLVGSFAAVQLLKFVLAYYFLSRHFLKARWAWQFGKVRQILKHAYPFALTGLFGTISTRIDIIMLKIFHTESSVGIYNVARKIVESISFLPENISYALFPALSLLYVSNRPQFDRTFQRSLQALLAMAIPVVALLYILAPVIIGTLFQPEFLPAYLALRWLAFALGLIFLKHVFAATLSAVGRQHLWSVLVGVGMVLNVGLNYLLIPRYEISGAAVATLISEGLTLAAAIYFTRRHLHLPRISARTVRLLLAGLAVVLLTNQLRHWPLLWLLIIIPLIYALLLVVLRVVSREDWNYLRGLIFSRLSPAKTPGAPFGDEG